MSDIYDECLKTLIDEYTAGDFYREIYRAKQEYFADFGVVNEDDPDFENQMDIFMGWYLFDRNLSGYDLPPVKLYFRKYGDSLPEEKRQLARNLIDTTHSIFETLKRKDDIVVLREYCTRRKYEVVDSRYSMGFSKGDIFEARLIPLPDGKRHCFAAGFCFHPKESSKFIDGQIKKIRHQDVDQRNKLILMLGKMKLKHQRYPHIDVKHIYTLEPKF